MKKPSPPDRSLVQTRKIRARLFKLLERLRVDIAHVTEPNVHELFQSAAEVLIGLMKAFDACEKRTAEAWAAKAVVAKKLREVTRRKPPARKSKRRSS